MLWANTCTGSPATASTVPGRPRKSGTSSSSPASGSSRRIRISNTGTLRAVTSASADTEYLTMEGATAPTGVEAAVAFKQAREKGYMGMFLSDDGFDSSDAAKIGGEALMQGAGTYFSTVAGPAAVYPDTAKFIADFTAKFGATPQPFAAQAYD